MPAGRQNAINPIYNLNEPSSSFPGTCCALPFQCPTPCLQPLLHCAVRSLCNPHKYSEYYILARREDGTRIFSVAVSAAWTRSHAARRATPNKAASHPISHVSCYSDVTRVYLIVVRHGEAFLRTLSPEEYLALNSMIWCALTRSHGLRPSATDEKLACVINQRYGVRKKKRTTLQQP